MKSAAPIALKNCDLRFWFLKTSLSNNYKAKRKKARSAQLKTKLETERIENSGERQISKMITRTSKNKTIVLMSDFFGSVAVPMDDPPLIILAEGQHVSCEWIHQPGVDFCLLFAGLSVNRTSTKHDLFCSL